MNNELKALVERWREEAKEWMGCEDCQNGEKILRSCADELSALLSAPVPQSAPSGEAEEAARWFDAEAETIKRDLPMMWVYGKYQIEMMHSRINHFRLAARALRSQEGVTVTEEMVTAALQHMWGLDFTDVEMRDSKFKRAAMHDALTAAIGGKG